MSSYVSGALGWIYMGINRKVTSPDLVNLVDMTDALDPLNIVRGSRGLKDAEHLNARIYLNRLRNEVSQNYGLTYNMDRNALAMGYDYNSATGVRESRMYNVNGNWNLLATQDLEFGFGPTKSFMAGNGTNLYYNRSVDMLGENNSGVNRNIVNNYKIGESLKVGYNDKKVRVIMIGNCDWNRFTSGQTGFKPFNA